MSNFYGDVERTITNVEDETILVCEECGCKNIHSEAWLNINTKEFVEWSVGVDYCPDCQCETTCITLEEYKASKDE